MLCYCSLGGSLIGRGVHLTFLYVMLVIKKAGGTNRVGGQSPLEFFNVEHRVHSVGKSVVVPQPRSTQTLGSVGT